MLITILAAETIADGSTPSEAASADVPCTKNAGLPIPVISSIDASTCPQQSAVQDPLTGGEPIISISYDGDHMDNRVVETEVRIYISLDTWISPLTTKLNTYQLTNLHCGSWSIAGDGYHGYSSFV